MATAVAFNTNNGATSSTLVYQDCVGGCTDSGSESMGSGDESTCTEEEDKDAGHGNDCDGDDPDNPGKGK